MGWWQVSADTLAGSRFVTSPLAETVAALKTLHDAKAAHPGERAWLDAHLADYRAWLAADPITAALVETALGARWNATFLTPTPSGDGAGFEEELARIRRTPAEVARADLVESSDGRLPAGLLDRKDLPGRAADLLERVWRESVRPTWPRRRGIAEADVVARTTRLAAGGWAAALADMRPGMRWLGGDRLQITTRESPPLELAGVSLLFVPVTFARSWVCWDVTTDTVPAASGRRFAVVYPCSGVLAAAADGAGAPGALAALLGSARAELLAWLESPCSTTQLVALTGLPLGSVGRHLRILREARLVERRRAGRSVLYYRTTAGQALLDAQG
ncbi:ArsR/SmtB family transcription factor [Streptacidiphilus jiangxiensis]|uniref:Helix-turn-helix domain-containing protein n=1 Tax=Streptacidiphilus jiangxiensis TaxID=235985 RepID=A0A1H7R266_STRJI|nr:helix-turn-helix domain-containing protein [Streptacidiphilus jiangxiensis]SEL53657.1 Helix-turn-helix domain-containing protein [Streptacidiphilus jiangxiensis]